MGIRPPPYPRDFISRAIVESLESAQRLIALEAGTRITAAALLAGDIFAQEEAWAREGGPETFSEWRERLQLAADGKAPTPPGRIPTMNPGTK